MLLSALLWLSTTVASAPPAGRLEGSAILGRHRPVVGATVVASADPNRFDVTTTDARGRFVLEGLADGSYRVEVTREGLEPVVKEGVELRFPFRAVVEVQLQPVAAPQSGATPAAVPQAPESAEALELRGRVVEGAGSAGMSDVALRLTHAAGLTDPRLLRSRTDGSFEVRDGVAGAWILETRSVGYLPVRAALQLARDSRIEIRLVRQPASYEPSALELMPPEELPVPEGLAPPPIGVLPPAE
jgi:hypothetical protein